MTYLTKFLRDPLVHFLLIGGGLFLLYSYVYPVPDSDRQTIIVDEGRIIALAESFNRTWNREPTQAELRQLVEDYVLEEIYYRQAVAMGLDKNDSLIRRRLRQKMEFLTSSMATAQTPADDELQSYMVTHSDQYQSPARFSFQQIYIDPSQHGDALDATMASIRSALVTASSEQALDITSDSVLLSDIFTDEPDFLIDKTFGTGFARQLSELPIDEWQGPVSSALGLHFVRVTDYQAASLPSLEVVRDIVTRDWAYQEDQRIKNQLRDNLLTSYDITVLWPTESDKGS